MAIITLGSFITDIRGSVGGMTFQRSSGGLALRIKPIPTKASTTAQLLVKQRQSRLNFEWLELSQTERDNWKDFSNFVNGLGFTNTGRKSANLGKMSFINVNYKLITYNKPVLAVPTFTTAPSPVTPCPPLFTESDILTNYTGSIDITKEILITNVSLHQSPATNTANTGFRTLIYTQVNGDNQDWQPAYRDAYGVGFITGKKYWIELQVVNFITGQVSTKTKSLVLYTGPTQLGIGMAVIETSFIVG